MTTTTTTTTNIDIDDLSLVDDADLAFAAETDRSGDTHMTLTVGDVTLHGTDEQWHLLAYEIRRRSQIVNRFEGAVTEYGRDNEDLVFSFDTPFLLVEYDRHYWLTLWPTLEDAGEYCHTDEGNWEPRLVIDLRSGEEYRPVVSTVFKKEDGQ